MSAPQPAARSAQSPWRKYAPWLYAVVLLAVVAIVVLQRREEQEIVRLAREAEPIWLILALVFQAGTYLSDAALWRHAIVQRGEQRGIGLFLSLAFARLFINQTVPTAGVASTLFVLGVLEKRGVPPAIAMAAVVVELITYYASYVLALLAAIAVAWRMGTLSLLVIVGTCVFVGAAVAISGAIVLIYRGGQDRLPKWVRRVPVVKSFAETLAGVSPRDIERPSVLIPCTIYQLLVFAFDAATLWIMVFALGSSIGPAACAVSYMLGNLAKSLGLMPGGLGTFEAVVVASLHLDGVPVVTALGAALLYRGVSFWLPLLPGSVFVRRLSRG